jgi:N-methylhydantoinase A
MPKAAEQPTPARAFEDGAYIVSTDSGGTFVDAVILDAKGKLTIGKSPTTPDDPAKGIIAAVGAAAARAGVDLHAVLGQCAMFLNGTTVTTNAMVQRTGAKTGMITTRGFEDTLIIGRVRSRWVGLDETALVDFKNVERPPPVVPTNLIRGVAERIDCFGKVVLPLDLTEAEKAIDELVSAGIESLAVCLLWSFKNPSHETAIAALARRKYPSLYVVGSSQLVQSMGEYERANTAAVDAYLGPTLNTYLANIGASLEASGYRGELLVMQSIGGLAPASGLLQAAVTTLQSGPAGGVIGAQKLGQLIGEPNVITADMGGTTFDVGIIVDGWPQTAKTSVTARNLLLVPAVEAISIGAGGGSIAWLDSANVLHVGPQSQGARPGPACYGRGGTLPTVTDADVVLGYINPDRFLGGGMPLRADFAHDAVRTHIAAPLGISVEAAAQAIYDIVNAHMADLVRSVTVGRGFDPRDFAVVAFGGCGPTHCTGFGPDCQPRRIIVPPAATVLSALGIAQSDIKHFHTRTFVRSLDAKANAQDELAQEINAHFDELIALTNAQFEREGIAREHRAFVRSVDIRYRKQVHELTVPIGVSGRVDGAALAAVVDDFVRTYERTYGAGSSIGKSGLEVATLRVDGIAKIPRIYETPRGERGPPSPALASLGRRKVWWKEFGGFRDTDAYQLEKLACGNIVEGPAIIEAYGTSIPLHPGQLAHVDEWLNLLVEITPARTSAKTAPIKVARASREMMGENA